MEHQVSTWNTEASGCSDVELVAGLRKLTAADFKLGAKLIVYIAEVDARGVWREHAYPSLFMFLAQELQMSEGQAYLRIQAAQLAQKYPVIISMLATGAVHISALRQISRLLTDENHLQLLERVRGKSKRQIEKIVAELDPKPDVPSQMRKVPQRAARAGSVSGNPVAARAQSGVPSAQQPVAAPGRASDACGAPTAATSSAASDASADCSAAASSAASHASADCAAAASSAAAARDAEAPRPSAASAEFVLEAPREKRGSSTPLGPGRYKVQITVDEAMHSTLEQLQQLLRHRVPNGDLAVIIELGVDLLLAKTKEQRFGKTPSKKATSPSKASSTSNTESASSESEHAMQPEPTRAPKRRSRYIRRAIMRAVHERDEGQCSFVSAEGKRCAERGFSQTHHDHPFARGGESTVENLQVMCHTHNQLLAERDFGRAYMQSKRSRTKLRRRRKLAQKPGHV